MTTPIQEEIIDGLDSVYTDTPTIEVATWQRFDLNKDLSKKAE